MYCVTCVCCLQKVNGLLSNVNMPNYEKVHAQVYEQVYWYERSCSCTSAYAVLRMTYIPLDMSFMLDTREKRDIHVILNISDPVSCLLHWTLCS